MMRPPLEIFIMWCPVCGRDDRYQAFTGRSHHFKGKRCLGTPERTEYVLKEAMVEPQPIPPDYWETAE